MEQTEVLKIRPYARLLTMLGDQLIKDEIVALVELVKNSYDADAEHVTIFFNDFGENGTTDKNSTLVIEDDGNGMNVDTLKDAWMNPATPEKLKRKRKLGTTDKGRIMQGEKGIGRFAIFKLGNNIQIITRRQKKREGHFVDAPESGEESILSYNFSDYDADFLRKGEEEKDIFLEDLNVELVTRTAETIVEREQFYGSVRENRKPYGTKIVISGLKGSWNNEKIEKVYQNMLRMQPVFGDTFKSDFNIYLYQNGEEHVSKSKNLEDIKRILEDKSVFVVEGSFDDKQRCLSFHLNNHNNVIPYKFCLDDPEMIGIRPMKSFLDDVRYRELECGSFGYKFYIMDLDVNIRDQDTRFYLDRDEIESIKNHRVYLYRDGIRVMPYGDPDDDWLRLDVIRGTEKSGRVFGNDQIVGYVTISQKNNPNLRDKTNREGLIEEGYGKEDLVNICQLLLRYLRAKPYTQYLIEKKNRKTKKDEDRNRPLALIENARKMEQGRKTLNQLLEKYGDTPLSEIRELKKTVDINTLPHSTESSHIVDQAFSDALKKIQAVVNEAEQAAQGWDEFSQFLNRFEESYKKEIDVLDGRIATTENLAAIGLSAETAYHDARKILSETNNALSNLVRSYQKESQQSLDRETVLKALDPIWRNLETALQMMNDIQRLFPSTRRKRSSIDVQQTVRKVKDLYAVSLIRNGISCNIEIVSDQILLVESTDAVLLQVFINLFDNSIYWLKTVGTDRRILVKIDPDKKTVLFSDSGPGVRQEDVPYIFEAFYSGKGEEGKGLGLYIARQLLGRYNSTINLITEQKDKILKGANFLICFEKEEG